MKIPSVALAITLAFTSVAVHAAPPSPDGNAVRGQASNESPEMQALLASFNLTVDQRAKYEAARAETSRQMREIHEGKVQGTLSQDEVLKKALASHKAFNAAVKAILTAEQYAQWEPLREADHHKIAQAHKTRDEAAATKDPTK